MLAILADGSVVTWGHADYGSDSSAVQERLKGVQQIQATLNGAFAAILGDGSVVTWGNAQYGGDSSAVQDQLRGVQQIQATEFAFGCDSGRWIRFYVGVMQTLAVTVRQFKSSSRVCSRFKPLGSAFAAILADGSVVAWGGAGGWR